MQKAELVEYPMQLDLCERHEVVALLFGPVIDPNILSPLQLPSMGLLLLVMRRIVILIIQKEQLSNTK
jgi:hypothetical protein